MLALAITFLYELLIVHIRVVGESLGLGQHAAVGHQGGQPAHRVQEHGAGGQTDPEMWSLNSFSLKIIILLYNSLQCGL